MHFVIQCIHKTYWHGVFQSVHHFAASQDSTISGHFETLTGGRFTFNPHTGMLLQAAGVFTGRQRRIAASWLASWYLQYLSFSLHAVKAYLQPRQGKWVRTRFDVSCSLDMHAMLWQPQMAQRAYKCISIMLYMYPDLCVGQQMACGPANV